MKNQRQGILVAVVATNASGSPDLFLVRVFATPEQIENGEHYDAAKAYAEAKWFEKPMIAIDPSDDAASALESFFHTADSDTAWVELP